MAQFDKARRLKLKAGKKPYFERVGRGLALGYRRNAGAGVWVIREILDDGNSRLRKFATADDLEAANGVDVLTYAQALQYANRVALKSAKTQTVTVEDAISDYEEDLMARGLNVRARYNATVLRYYLKDMPFYKKPVSLLEKKALTEVRDGMVASGKKPATADRLGASLRAALNLAASRDPRITNARVWKEGWEKLPDSSVARTVILPDDVVAALVRAAYKADHKLGVYFDVLAETGTRESRMLRLRVSDLQDDPANPRLMMSGYSRGKNRKLVQKPVPISPRLAGILRAAAAGRSANDPLLDKIVQPALRFREIAQLVGGVDPEATPYSFRCSSIVRMLRGHVPIGVVASLHDTSAAVIDRQYSALIGDVSESAARATLPDFGMPAGRGGKRRAALTT